MEPTIELEPAIEPETIIDLDLTKYGYAVSDRRLGLRQRLEGRAPADDPVELDLRAIAQERLALVPRGRRR